VKRSTVWLQFSIIGVVLLGCATGLSACDHGEVSYLPVPTTTPRVSEEFPVCFNPATQWQPAISGNIVVWEDLRNEENVIGEDIGNGDIYGYDLSTGEEFTVASESWDEGYIAISGNTIVWLSEPEEGIPSIRGYDLTDGEEFLVYQGYDCDSWGHQPGINENLVVFRGGNYAGWYIWGYDLATGVTSLITEMDIYEFKPPPNHPSLGGHIIAWEDDRLDQSGFDIWGYDLSTGTVFPICTDPDPQWEPAVSENGVIVWEDWRDDKAGIYGFDPSSGSEFPVCTELFAQDSAAISGNIVVWQDSRHGNWDIYGFDLSTGTEFPICIDPANQRFPAISGNIVVWQDYRNGNADIYGARLSD
jgi:TolB protein